MGGGGGDGDGDGAVYGGGLGAGGGTGGEGLRSTLHEKVGGGTVVSYVKPERTRARNQMERGGPRGGGSASSTKPRRSSTDAMGSAARPPTTVAPRTASTKIFFCPPNVTLSDAPPFHAPSSTRASNSLPSTRRSSSCPPSAHASGAAATPSGARSGGAVNPALQATHARHQHSEQAPARVESCDMLTAAPSEAAPTAVCGSKASSSSSPSSPSAPSPSPPSSSGLSGGLPHQREHSAVLASPFTEDEHGRLLTKALAWPPASGSAVVPSALQNEQAVHLHCLPAAHVCERAQCHETSKWAKSEAHGIGEG